MKVVGMWPRMLLVGAVVGMTAFLALAPGAYSPLAPLADDWVPVLDHRHVVVAAHLLGYAGMVVLLSWLWRRLLWSAAAVLVFSTVLEAAQTQLPWREGSWADLGVNLVAVLLGVWVVWVLGRLGGRG